MANRVLGREEYESLVQAYREQPGNYSHASRRIGCDARMAKRAWHEGWQKRHHWARPIKDIIFEEHLAIRARTAKAEEDRMVFKEAEYKRAAQEASEVLIQEGKILSQARANLQVSLSLTGQLSPMMQILVSRVYTAIEAKELTPRQALDVIRTYNSITLQGAQAADKLIEAERRKKGEPTEIIGLQVEAQHLSVGEALAELEAMRDMLASATERGLVTTDGTTTSENGFQPQNVPGEVN